MTVPSELPAEWAIVPRHVRWPDPILLRRYEPGAVVVEDPDGDEVIRSDTVADDVVDGIEK
ncbi:hypothetical protein [Haloplanus salinarum]|uniref:hypothetical protein n=1 Tax=Haloplanus salinarum TaxID=1912324 RepID=UPI00214AC481|nr:hypothetical protein [Haloplanus salinarum]